MKVDKKFIEGGTPESWAFLWALTGAESAATEGVPKLQDLIAFWISTKFNVPMEGDVMAYILTNGAAQATALWGELMRQKTGAEADEIIERLLENSKIDLPSNEGNNQ